MVRETGRRRRGRRRRDKDRTVRGPYLVGKKERKVVRETGRGRRRRDKDRTVRGPYLHLQHRWRVAWLSVSEP